MDVGAYDFPGNSRPTLRISKSDQTVTLAWPSWANNFALQESDSASATSGPWANVPGTSTSTNNESVLALPANAAARFYRLYHP